MARRRSYSRKSSRSGGARRTSRSYSRRSTASRRYSSGGSRRGRSGRSGGTIKLVIETSNRFGQAAEPVNGAVPGIPGTVGIAALGPKRKSAF